MSVVILAVDMSADNVGTVDTQPDFVSQQNNVKITIDVVGRQ